MTLLSERERRAVQNRLRALEGSVKLIHFTQELECPSCPETRRLLQEVAALSEKLALEIYNFQLDREKVAEYRIDKVPATVIERDRDSGIRLYGLPSGNEFASLLEGIVAVSCGRSDLEPATVERLRAIDRPVHLQVFVTPT